MKSKLKITSRNILDEILAQLENRDEVLREVEATITIRELAYRRGEFIVKKVHQEQRILGDKKSLEELSDPCGILTSSTSSLEELPSDRQNAIRIRVKPANPRKFDLMHPRAEDHQAAIAVINKTPVRLVEMKLLFVNLPWWIECLFKSFEAKVEFEYVRGVPIPKKAYSRAQSKGIGRWRIGGGEEIEVQYKE
jgi:hypothetical protein